MSHAANQHRAGELTWWAKTQTQFLRISSAFQFCTRHFTLVVPLCLKRLVQIFLTLLTSIWLSSRLAVLSWKRIRPDSWKRLGFSFDSELKRILYDDIKTVTVNFYKVLLILKIVKAVMEKNVRFILYPASVYLSVSERDLNKTYNHSEHLIGLFLVH